MSGLGGDIVDAYLKRRKTALQLDRALLRTFLRAEFGLQAPIDFESETGFGQFDRSAGHSGSIVMAVGLDTVSPVRRTSPF
jgi:hypothetical protein